jgi:hypothetical protein
MSVAVLLIVLGALLIRYEIVHLPHVLGQGSSRLAHF